MKLPIFGSSGILVGSIVRQEVERDRGRIERGMNVASTMIVGTPRVMLGREDRFYYPGVASCFV
jgi:hypothetical protein